LGGIRRLHPLMRIHEGNKPKDNWQMDRGEETMRSVVLPDDRRQGPRGHDGEADGRLPRSKDDVDLQVGDFS